MKLFNKNLINIVLKYKQKIRKAKKHNLIFEIIILDFKVVFNLLFL